MFCLITLKYLEKLVLKISFKFFSFHLKFSTLNKADERMSKTGLHVISSTACNYYILSQQERSQLESIFTILNPMFRDCQRPRGFAKILLEVISIWPRKKVKISHSNFCIISNRDYAKFVQNNRIMSLRKVARFILARVICNMQKKARFSTLNM